MSEPIYSDSMERLYAGQIPEYIRVADIVQAWTLKKWLAGIVDRLGEVDTFIDRFNYISPEEGPGYRTSDLVDPNTANAAWLPWLSQLVGVKLQPSDDVPTQRSRIANVLGSIQGGTKQSMAIAAQTVLSGTKSISIIDHSTSAPGDGGEWDVMVVTASSERLSDPAAAIIAAGQKPAGVLLHSVDFLSTWTTVLGAYPNWTAWNGITWQQLEEAGL